MSKVSINWKTKSKKLLLENKFVNMWEEEVELPDGSTATYYVQRKKPFSIIIPIEGKYVYMVKQYRYSVASLSLEFPMGNAKGSPEEVARTELKEETGIVANELVQIGRYWFGPGRTNQEACVFVAKDLQFEEAEPEEGELIDVEKHTIEDIEKMIENREILDGPTIVAYHYLENYLKKNPS